MDFEAARKHMVDSQVRPNDVTDIRIQRAFETIPREMFLPAELGALAYVDREVVYADGRALPTARDFSKLLAALNIKSRELVLDAACGAGYSTAILAALCDMVVAVERDESLVKSAEEKLYGVGAVNTAVVQGDPAAGAAQQGPFDVIVIAQAIDVEPAALLGQLKDGGRLGAFFRVGGVSKGSVWRRSGAAIARVDVFDASARTALQGFTRPKTFVF